MMETIKASEGGKAISLSLRIATSTFTGLGYLSDIDG